MSIVHREVYRYGIALAAVALSALLLTAVFAAGRPQEPIPAPSQSDSAARPPSPSQPDPIAPVRTSYDQHNYKQAAELAQRIIAAAPNEYTLHEAQKLRALSLCQLREAGGAVYVRQLMAEHEPFADDPQLWQAIGDDRFQRGDRREAYEAYVKAGELYAAGELNADAADAYFRAAECLQSYHALPLATTRPVTWEERRKAAIDERLRLYDLIGELPIDDERHARALLLGGRAAAEEGSWLYAEKALQRFTVAAEKYADTVHAPQAQFEAGQLYQRFSRFVEAVAAYEKAVTDFGAPDIAKAAREQIKQIKAPQLTVATLEPYRPGRTPVLYWQTRNIRRVELAAYEVDLPAVFAKLSTVKDRRLPDAMLKAVLADGAAPAAEWSFQTPDEARHQYHQYVPQDADEPRQTTQPIDFPLDGPGAYLVRATGVNPDNARVESVCLVLITRLASVAKADDDEALIFVADAADGEPAGGAEAVVLRMWGGRPDPVAEEFTGKTDDAGIARIELPERRSYSAWVAAVCDGEHQAICAPGGYNWHWWGFGGQYVVYGFTERPVYRPGQTVQFKQIIRSSEQGTYKNLPDAKVRVEIRDPKGETIYAADHVTDEFGSLAGSLAIADGAPLGVYQINLSVAGRRGGLWSQGNRFRVEEYKKPEFKVTVEPGQDDYRVGEEMKIRIAADYYFGQPVADAQVNFTVRKQSYEHRIDPPPRPYPWYYDDVYSGMRWRPWWYPRFDELATTGTVTTDADGKAYITVQATPIAGHEELDLKFLVEAEVADASRRVIRGAGEVKVTRAPFFVNPRPAQAVYGPGDSVEINVETEDPNGTPVSGRFEVQAWTVLRVRKTPPVSKPTSRPTTEPLSQPTSGPASQPATALAIEEQDIAIEVLPEPDGDLEEQFEEKLGQQLYSGRIEVGPTGRASFRFTPDVGGRLKVIVRQLDAPADQPPVEGNCELWVAPREGVQSHYAYNDLQIIPSDDQFEIGQTMKLLVNVARPGSRVLLTGEADVLLWWRIVQVQGNSQLVEIPITDDLTPNFTLTATLIRDNKVFRDDKQIVVPPTHKFIKVEAMPGEGSLGGGTDSTYQPREKADLRIKLTDVRTGEPLVGQAAVMLVDSSVYYIQPEFREAIEKAFYGRVRPVLVATSDSYAGPSSVNPGLFRREQFGIYAGSELKMARGGAMPAAAPAMEMAEADMAAKDEAGAGLVEPVVREEFKDTVLWAGSVVTNADGMAEIPFTLPDQLTTFALHVIAADKETRVGQASTEIVTTKRVIVRLASGRFFTEGDRAQVTVIAHNYYDEAQTLAVDLAASENLRLEKVYLGGQWQDYASGESLDVDVPAGGEVRLDFLTEALRPGEVELLARARGSRESDALKQTLPILPWGARKIESSGGTLAGEGRDERTWTFEVPTEIKPGSQTLTVTLNPSAAAVAIEALPMLADYPYGCVEQTMSRFMPTVLVRRTLQDAGVSLDDIRELIDQRSSEDPKLAARYEMLRKRLRHNPVYSSAEVDKMVKAGLNRLADMQHGDGGWGWWKHGDSDPYMTAYVAYGLSVARDCDVSLPDGMLERARNFLVTQAERPKRLDERNWWWRHLDNDNTRAYVLFALGRLDAATLKRAKVAADLQRIYEDRDELTDYGRAYLALALHAAGQGEQARIVVENFQNTVQYDSRTDSAHWGRHSGWWYWYDGATETTAWVLQAMLEITPESPQVGRAVRWLANSRRELTWGNTKATATAVYALIRYARAAGELDCDQTFEVALDDSIATSVRVTRENLFSFDGRVEVDASQLEPGLHTVRISREGRGRLYWGGYLRYFTTAERIEGGGHRLAITREYFRLVPEEFTNTRTVWKDGQTVQESFKDLRYSREPLAFGAEIASGEMVEVELTIDAEYDLEYMMFEDPKPAGCEPYRLTSGGSYAGGTYANIELRDTKVALFASHLRQGSQKLSYRLVCEQPGTFRILPSAGEAMYSPFVEAISDSGKMTIVSPAGD